MKPQALPPFAVRRSPFAGEASLDYRAAKEGLAHRIRPTAILDVEGSDRVAFLQGQLTQDVKGMQAGQTLPAAGLTPRGKLLFLARLHAMTDRLRLLLPSQLREAVLGHLKKYAVFQNAAIADASDDFVRIGLYGPSASCLAPPPGEAVRLSGEWEFAAEIVAPAASGADIEEWLRSQGSIPVEPNTGEALRIEAGRPRFGRDADETHLIDEVGLDDAVSTTKGCYVGQEIVARMRTYGRVNRRLVGFRFPEGALEAGALLRLPEEPEPGKIEQGRVTSAAVSPDFGPIGLGYAFRDVPPGGRLLWAENPSRSAIVSDLPFA